MRKAFLHPYSFSGFVFSVMLFRNSLNSLKIHDYLGLPKNNM